MAWEVQLRADDFLSVERIVDTEVGHVKWRGVLLEVRSRRVFLLIRR